MSRALAVALVLGALPGAARAAGPAAPEVELVLTDEALTTLLRAGTPYETTIEQDLGLGGAARLAVTLTNPSVHVTNAAVKAKVDVRVRDASGLVDVSGVATPDLQIVAVPAKGVLEARFVRLSVTLPGGIALPIDASLPPILLPGVWRTDVTFGDRVMTAEARAVDVVPEIGRARVRGTLKLEPRKAAGAR